MNVYALPAMDNCIPDTPRCVALGLFDGLHLGHRQVVLAATQDLPDGVTRCVYTFRPESVTTKPACGRLDTAARLQEQLTAMGVDELLEVEFSAVQQLSPEAFVEQVLHRQLGAVQVACGYNYRFGKNGAGDAHTLVTLCAARGIRVTVVPPVCVDGKPVSSTAIRQALSAGDMDTTRRLLGRGYSLRLPVTPGQQLGRTLGTPTINQPLPAELLCPRYGVYASCVEIEGDVFPAVTNIGVRPTVGADTPLAETYLLHYSGDLYGTTPTVYPVKFLRDEQTFPSLEALRRQVAADAADAEALVTPPEKPEIRAIFFDFDDTLGVRDTAFRQGLERLVRYYCPHLPEEEILRRREEMFYHNRTGYGTPMAYIRLVSHFLTKWGLEAEPETALRRLCDGFAADYPLHADVLPTLIRLREMGYKLGLITNGNSYPQNRKLDCSGLRPYLDLTVICGDEEVQKPDPLIFRRAAARLGVPVECCLFVGDHPRHDMQAALDAGMQAVRKDAAHEPEHPFYSLPLPDTPVIHRISQLIDWLAAATT